MVETTISGKIYLKYLQKAKQAGFRTILVYVALPDIQTSLERVRNRVLQGGHNVPTEDIKRLYFKSFNNLKHYINDVDLAYIYDNGNRYERVANFRNGKKHKNFETSNVVMFFEMRNAIPHVIP